MKPESQITNIEAQRKSRLFGNHLEGKSKTNPITKYRPTDNAAQKSAISGLYRTLNKESYLEFYYFFQKTVSRNCPGLSRINVIRFYLRRYYRVRCLMHTCLLKILTFFSHNKLLSIMANGATECENQDRRKYLELFCEIKNNEYGSFKESQQC